MDVDPGIVQTLKVDSNLECYTSNKHEEPLRLSGQLNLLKLLLFYVYKFIV